MDRIKAIREEDKKELEEILRTSDTESEGLGGTSKGSNITRGDDILRKQAILSRSPVPTRKAVHYTKGSIPGRVQSVSAALEQARRIHEKDLLKHHQQVKSQTSQGASPSATPKAQHKFEELLTYRQRLLSRIQDRVTEYVGTLSGMARDWHADMKYRKEVDKFRSSLLECQDEVPLMPVLHLLRSTSFPLGDISRDFIKRQRKLVLLEDGAHRVIEECRLFEYHVCTVISDIINDKDKETSIRLSVEDWLFGEEWLGSALLCRLYHGVYSGKQAILDTLLTDLAWDHEQLGAKLKLNPRYKVSPSAITELKQVSTFSTPFEKLLCLVHVCNTLCEPSSSDTDSDTLPTSPPTPSEGVGGEDLLRLFAMTIIRAAPLPTLLADLFFIGELCPEALLRGEAGYVLATVSGAVEYLMHLNEHDA